MSETATLQRRELRFETLDELSAEVERLADADSLTLLGKWSYPQIVQHIANGMHLSIDGAKWNAPWWMKLLARTMKKRMLTKGMKPGFRLPEGASKELVAEADVSLDEAMASFRQGIHRLQTEEHRAPHMVFGNMTREEWNLLHLRHGELHLSFVVD